jgi:hypothetical protein
LRASFDTARDGLIDATGIDIGQREPCPSAGQVEREGPADPRTSTRDHRNPVGEPSHHASFSPQYV